jgi:hypothetical protein
MTEFEEQVLQELRSINQGIQQLLVSNSSGTAGAVHAGFSKDNRPNIKEEAERRIAEAKRKIPRIR